MYWAARQQTSWVIAPWWFNVSPWRICITFIWPSSSQKLTAPSSPSECHLHFALIRLCLALLFIISISMFLGWFLLMFLYIRQHGSGVCILLMIWNSIWFCMPLISHGMAVIPLKSGFPVFLSQATSRIRLSSSENMNAPGIMWCEHDSLRRVLLLLPSCWTLNG